MSLGMCPACKSLQHFDQCVCQTCGAALEFAFVRGVETPEEKAERERLEMLEEALRMNF